VISSRRAVFLSYASEDAVPAARICESLRAAGIEVWFDQAELRGGDAWDATIRRQIKDCALFLPVISANTHARIEGYFRLEWKLAVDRSHLISPDQAFVLPVVIDQTPQTDERIPDRFRELHWTCAPAGNLGRQFIERVTELLRAPEERVAMPVPQALNQSPVVVTRRKGSRAFLWIASTVALALGALATYRIIPTNRIVTAKGPAAIPAPSTPQAQGLDKSIAVLPFVNMSEDRNQEYFADGLSEELIDLLTRVPELRVVARTSSFAFRGRPTSVAEIGKALAVGHVVEGSVRKAGDSIRVTVQLVEASSGYHLWSQSYDRKLSDIFSIQDDIATAVVRTLKVRLLWSAWPSNGQARHAQTYNVLLQCRFLSRTGSDREARQCYERAAAADPQYALGWALLATDYDRADPRSCDAARKAVHLDPDLPTAHVAMAYCYEYADWNWTGATAEIQRALAQDVNNFGALGAAAELALHTGRFHESLEFSRRALERDPVASGAWAAVADALWFGGDLDQAVEHYRQALALQPGEDYVHWMLGFALTQSGDPVAGLSEVQQIRQDSYRNWALAVVCFAMHRKADSDHALTELTRKYGATRPFLVSEAHAYRKELDLAYEWLEKAYQQHDPDLAWLRVGFFAGFYQQSDPRFLQIVRKLNFPE
jgi:TolB-like protein/Tfp pilus assembly protein PilF